jgi:hypothetical protein
MYAALIAMGPWSAHMHWVRLTHMGTSGIVLDVTNDPATITEATTLTKLCGIISTDVTSLA